MRAPLRRPAGPEVLDPGGAGAPGENDDDRKDRDADPRQERRHEFRQIEQPDGALGDVLRLFGRLDRGRDGGAGNTNGTDDARGDLDVGGADDARTLRLAVRSLRAISRGGAVSRA